MTTNLNDKLAQLTSKEPSPWLENAKNRKANRGWLKKSAFIALKVLQELRKQGITQRDLAERMSLSPQQVNKIVKGQENLTLETIDKIERALHIQLLQQNQVEVTPRLNFGILPAAIRHYGGSMHFECRNAMQMEVFIIKMTDDCVIKIDPKSEVLHTRFPIEGKEEWVRLHSELS